MNNNNREKMLNTFSAIGTFIEQISSFFDAKNHLDDQVLVKLALYERLIEKTGPTNVNAISRNLDAFNCWLSENYDACLTQNVNDLSVNVKNISYSENVYLPLNDLLHLLNTQNKNDELVIMWKHILNISFKLTDDENIKHALISLYKNKNSENENKGGGCDEEQMINNTIDELKNELDSLEVSNPKQAITALAKSGALERIIDNITTGMESGNFDMNKMFNVVFNKLGNETGGQVNLSGLAPLMNMMGNLTNSNNNNNESESIMFDEFQQ